MEIPHPLVPLSCSQCNSELIILNPLCSFQWHIWREEKLINLFSLAFWIRVATNFWQLYFQHDLPCHFPFCCFSFKYFRNQPPCHENFWATWNRQLLKFWGAHSSFLGYQDYYSSTKMENKDSFIKGLHFSLNDFMPEGNSQEFNVLFLLWMEQPLSIYLLAVDL